MNKIDKLSKVNLVQSNKITRSRCEFSQIELRIVYYIIRSLQKDDQKYFLNENGQYRDVTISIDLTSLSIDGETLSDVIKEAMRLKRRSVEIDRDGIWTYVSLLNYIQYNPKTKSFRLQISRMILPEYMELVDHFTNYEKHHGGSFLQLWDTKHLEI